MMHARSLEAEARELIDHITAGPHHNPLADDGAAVSSVLWVLSDLIGVVSEHPDKPALDHEDTIRQRIIEQRFADECGDPIDGPSDDDLDKQIDLVIQVLERVRQRALRRGIWGGDPAAPLMCG